VEVVLWADFGKPGTQAPRETRMGGGMIGLGVGLGLVVLFVGWIAWKRGSAGRHRARVREAVRAYVEKRGAVFELEANGSSFRVKGPLGEGIEPGAALDIMCRPGEEARWEALIGFALRGYIPDAFDEQFARAAAQRLEELAPRIAALDDDELRARLRVEIVPKRLPSEGLATCAVPLAGAYEARVVLDGFPLDGLPKAARVRLSDETDAQLYAHALAATLPDPAPSASEGEADTYLWLLRPDAIFGRVPHLAVISGGRLLWTPVARDEVEQRLVSLCQAAGQDGLAKNVLWAWDGEKLSAEGIVVHTILGPNTPDFTLRVPSSFHETLGIHPASDGTFGVRRPSGSVVAPFEPARSRGPEMSATTWLGDNVTDEFKLERYQSSQAQLEACFALESAAPEHLARIGHSRQRNLCYGMACGLDVDELRRVGRLGVSFYAAGFEGHDQTAGFSEVVVEGTTFKIDTANRAPSAMDWREAFFMAHVVGADDLLQRLCAADSRIPRPDEGNRYDHYNVLFAQALRQFWLGEVDAGGELLLAALRDANPDRGDLIAHPDSVARLAVPTQAVVAELAVGDEAAFNEKLRWAIDQHHRYFATHEPYAPQGFVSVPLWGLRTWATRRNMKVVVDSPYVPAPLL